MDRVHVLVELKIRRDLKSTRKTSKMITGCGKQGGGRRERQRRAGHNSLQVGRSLPRESSK